MQTEQRALVLGGGGITGIAWELGIVAGLAELGLDLRDADRFVGTSAGSIVGAQLTSGAAIEELYERQLAPPVKERLAVIGLRVKLGFAVALLRSRGDLTAFGRRLGDLSSRAERAGRLPSLQSRYDAITERLPSPDWPDADLRVTAVDAQSGAFRVFTRDDDVPLLDAVTASCAVPGVYPTVPIGGRRYIDGGARSGANADLAAGASRIVALTPMARAIGPVAGVRDQLSTLDVPHIVITPDQESIAAIGRNVLDPAARAPSARAGRAQAARVADGIAALWRPSG